MNRPFTSLLTALFVVHATFGCCLHHAHACDTGCCDAPAPAAAACPCHEHDEDGEAAPLVSADPPDAGDRQQPCEGPHRCQGDKCNLARITSPPDAKLVRAQTFPAVLARPAPLAMPVAKAALASAVLDPYLAAGMPRRHLVFAVLLI